MKTLLLVIFIILIALVNLVADVLNWVVDKLF